MNERWQKIDEVFHAALQRPAESREAFLSEACDGDTTLRQEIQKLLGSFEAAGSFLETPAGASFGNSIAKSSLSPGQQLAHYEIISLLGAGGMGEVYLATDLKLARRVALKILPSHLTQDPAQVERFDREARAASALNNPNIITIHEIGEEQGMHFIATEFIEGQTLRQRLASGPLATSEVISIATQIAKALAAAHAAGIIHRDVKPENVMVRPDGLVKVLDFGLVKLASGHGEKMRVGEAESGREGDKGPTIALTPIRPLAHSQDATSPGLIMGTVSYLSPEQVQRHTVDHRTDIFSLGVVLYEMLANARPFRGETTAYIFTAILQSEPAPIAAIDLPSALPTIVLRALAKDPARRYQSAAELATELSKIRVERTRAKLWLTVAAGSLIVLAAMGTWFWRTRRASFPRPPVFASAAQKLTDFPGEEVYPSLSPDGQTLVFASSQNGNWDIYRQSVGTRILVNLTADSNAYDMQPAFSPDGDRIVFRSSRDNGGIFVMNSDGTGVTKISDSGFNPTWSPDGTEVAVNDDNIMNYEARSTYPSASRLWAINVNTKAQRMIASRDAVQADWSPHGQRLAFWGEQKGGHRDIWTVAANGSSEPVPVTDDAFIDWNPIWSRDGSYLYFLSNRGGEMNLWRVGIDENTGSLKGQLEAATLPSNNCQHVSFARNGNSLVYGQSTRSENVCQIEFDPTRAQAAGPASFLTQGLKRYAFFSLAPDEQSFVYLARGEPQQDLFTADRSGTPLHRLTDDAAQDIVPRWSPDGKWIAFLSDRSGKYEIWKVRPDGSGLAQMTNEPGREVIAPVWSPDGSQLLYQIRNENSYIIDANRPGTDQVPRALPGTPPPGFIPWDWSPDANWLVGWQPLNKQRSIVIYSFAEQRYETFILGIGSYPIWFSDNQRVLFREGGSLYVLDRMNKKSREILTLKSPTQFGLYAFSHDNHRLYYTSGSAEADIWLLNVEGK